MESQQPRDTVVAFFSVAINFVAPCSIVSETTVWSDSLRDRVASLVDSGRIFTRYSYHRHESVHIFFAAKHGGSSNSRFIYSRLKCADLRVQSRIALNRRCRIERGFFTRNTGNWYPNADTASQVANCEIQPLNLDRRLVKKWLEK